MGPQGAGTKGAGELGPLLRRHREARGLLQEELATMVEPALSVTTVGNVERGRTRPHRHTLDALASALGLDGDQRAELTAAWRALGVEAPGAQADPASLPAICGVDAGASHLPVQFGKFVGREQERAAIVARVSLPEVRLLTLTGAGGIGKTRLALAAAADILGNFADGVFFVSLAPIADPGLVVSAIAQALGVPDAGGSLRDGLHDFLRDKHLLLVMDNFEHLLPAALLIPALLAEAPGVKVLVTSRAVLRVTGEHTQPVPPLRLPSRTALPPLEQLTQCEAVRLFLERAQAVKPDFRMTSTNAPAVAEICHQLDGLPLAIELAAARMRHIAPHALLLRLERRLSLLTGGARDLPARHQTLRGAIGWSYDLLTLDEQALFRRLAVFAGGCTLEAAEAVGVLEEGAPAAIVGPAGPIDLLDRLASLVDKSLMQHDAVAEGEPRYTMLETVREFALEQLVTSGEEPATWARYAEYYEALVQRVAPHFLRVEQLTWLARLDEELDNVRVVLQWLLDHDQRDRGQLLAGSLWYYWGNHGRVSEGRDWLTRLLAGPAAKATSDQARGLALLALGLTATKQYDIAACDEAFTESLALARHAGDAWTTAMALVRSAWTTERLEVWSATPQSEEADTPPEHAGPSPAEYYEDALVIFRWLGDDWGAAICQAFYAQFLIPRDAVRARNLATEAVEIALRLGDRWATALSLGQLARLAIGTGPPAEARRLLEQSLALSAELNDLYSVCQRLVSLAQLEMGEAEFENALALQERRVANLRLLGNRPQLAHALHDLAFAARMVGDTNCALLAYEESLALCQALGKQGEVAAVRASLGHLHRQRGELAQAAVTFAESLRVLADQDTELGIATVLAGLGGIALDAERPVEAARLLGAAEALLGRLATGSPLVAARLQTSLRGDHFSRDTTHAQELRAAGRVAFEAMGAEAFGAALDAGRALTTAEAVALGLEQAERSAEGTARRSDIRAERPR